MTTCFAFSDFVSLISDDEIDWQEERQMQQAIDDSLEVDGNTRSVIMLSLTYLHRHLP